MNWKNKLWYAFLIVAGIVIIVYASLVITTCMEFQRINSEAATYEEPQVIKEPEATDEEKAYYEEQKRKQQAELEAQQLAQQQAQAANIKEQKWKEAQLRVPPLTRRGGAGTSDGYRLTFYESTVLYHYLTPTWSLTEDHGGLRYYMEWVPNIQDWCFVISMNKSYGFSDQVIQFSFGPCIVRDSGCEVGTVDMYVY